MTDLASWLTAQLDHDEQVARVGGEAMGFDDPGYPDYQTYVDADTKAADAYLGAFSPAHVLRTVAAHRAILGRHRPSTERDVAENHKVHYVGVCMGCETDYQGGREWPCPDVLSIAAIYTDREGWDPSWTTEDR